MRYLWLASSRERSERSNPRPTISHKDQLLSIRSGQLIKMKHYKDILVRGVQLVRHLKVCLCL